MYWLHIYWKTSSISNIIHAYISECLVSPVAAANLHGTEERECTHTGSLLYLAPVGHFLLAVLLRGTRVTH